jgi:hypothetical protein
MTLITLSFKADANGVYTCSAPGDQSGDYVRAADAESLAEALSKLVWAVHYGRSFDASSYAHVATQLLERLHAQAANAIAPA